MVDLKELLKKILAFLTDKPIEVKEVKSSFYTILEIHAPKEERAFIIGKNGRTINAIRNIMSIIATKQKQQVLISVVD
ncbi:MAG: KH domain-containing protein [Candidatus Micrarchaeia archaeon]